MFALQQFAAVSQIVENIDCRQDLTAQKCANANSTALAAQSLLKRANFELGL